MPTAAEPPAVQDRCLSRKLEVRRIWCPIALGLVSIALAITNNERNVSALAEEAIDDLLCGFADDAARSPVALGHCRHEAAGLLERDVWRERNDVRIGLDLEDHRPIA